MASLQQLLDGLHQAIVPPTSAAASLPDPSDLAFERSLSRSLARNLDQESTRILSLVSSVLNWSQGAANSPTTLLDGDLIKDGAYSSVTEPIERLLERADEGIERHLGIGKAKQGVGAVGAKSAEELAAKKQAQTKQERLPAHLLHSADLAHPQLLFPPRLVLPRPDISAKADEEPLWKPVIKSKVHATNDDEAWLQTELYSPSDRFTAVTSTAPPPYQRYVHPYTTELKQLVPPSSFFDKPATPTPASDKSFEETPFEWVGDRLALAKMIKEIREVGKDENKKQLAVDLEHHDYRSWGGFTCLIQLSTRSKDYVIDALDPGVRDDLEELNEFFADPTWIKVFHGAASDIIWLQRDFGIYIVGLFDTYHATHVLDYSQHSLASLLSMYTDFEADKRYQVADWRIRPLPKEMLHYARSDTHYLLAIYDHLRLALHALSSTRMDEDDSSSPLQDVFTRSIGVSSSVFSIAPYDLATGHHENGWLPLLAKHQQLKAYSTALAIPSLPMKTGWGPHELKLEVLKAVHQWRSSVARELDESERWCLGNEGLWMIAERCPTEGVDVMKAVGMSRGGATEVLRKRKEEVAEVVREVVERVGEERKLVGDVVVGGEGEGTRGEAASEPAVRPVGTLWGEEEVAAPVASGSGLASVVAAGSSFFGIGSKSTTAAPISIVAASSWFLGGGNVSKSNNAKGKQVETAQSRLDAVARVHASLVLGGELAKTLQGQSIPAPIPVVAIESEPTSIDIDMDLPAPSDALTGDHSYVPLSARIPKQSTSTLNAASTTPIVPAPSDSDVLVVSSLKDKPKKRRRPTAPAVVEATTSATTATEPQSSPEKKVVKKIKKTKVISTEEPLAPHDYSTMKSILDAEPGLPSGGRGPKSKKDKKKEAGRAAKGFTVDTSDFRREPRVNNQPKKGNETKSFGAK